MKTISLILAAWLAAWAAVTALEHAAAQDAQTWPAHPRLLLDRQDIQSLTQRIAQNAWAERWTAFKAGVDKGLARPVELPPRVPKNRTSVSARFLRD